MPGVVVTTAVRTGPSTANTAPASTFFVAGTAERGPIDEARLVTSLLDFEAIYGDYEASKTLYQQVQTYFEEGGARAYVSRAVGASVAPTSGFLVVESALRIDAATPGSWSTELEVEVVANAALKFAVRLILKDELVYTSGFVATVDDAVAAINGSSVAAFFVTASTETGEGETVLTDSGPTALSAGSTSVPTEAELVDALELFDNALGAGAVAIPGYSSSTIWDGLIDHAQANNRIAVLGFASGDTASDAIDTVEGYVTENGEYAAYYFPHVTIPGPGGTSLTVSPEAYAAAKRSIAHNTVGPWQPGAGLPSRARFVTGLATSVPKTTGEELDDARINAIRIIQGSVRIYGARSGSDDETNFRYITTRDTLNYIVSQAEQRLEDLVFSPIDGRRSVFGQVEARLIALLDPLRTSGGLFEAFDTEGNRLDAGYSVEVSDALNPLSQLANGVIRAKVGVRVSSVSDRIEIEIVKSNLTSSVV